MRPITLLLCLLSFASVFNSSSEAHPYYGRTWSSRYHNSLLYWGWHPWTPFWNTTYPPLGYSYSYYYVRPPTFGAIAYSPSTGQVTGSWGHYSKIQAERRALELCPTGDCVSVLWVQGGCGAIVQSGTPTRAEDSQDSVANKSFGWAVARTKTMARNYAMRGCRMSGQKNCKPLAWVCSF